jgi:hypothetical protein
MMAFDTSSSTATLDITPVSRVSAPKTSDFAGFLENRYEFRRFFEILVKISQNPPDNGAIT